jgi:hypothetical protein
MNPSRLKICVCGRATSIATVARMYSAVMSTPALVGVARRQLQLREHEGDVERYAAKQPDHHRARARGRGGPDPADSKPGDEVEEEEIAKPHHPVQPSGRLLARGGRCLGRHTM